MSPSFMSRVLSTVGFELRSIVAWRNRSVQNLRNSCAIKQRVAHPGRVLLFPSLPPFSIMISNRPAGKSKEPLASGAPAQVFGEESTPFAFSGSGAPKVPDLSDFQPFFVAFFMLVAAGIGIPIPEELPV